MPRKSAKIAALLLFVAPLLGMQNCGVKRTERLPPEKIPPLKTATLEELLTRLRQQAEAVVSINAVTELVPSTGSAYSGVIEQYHDVRAFVLAQRRPAVGGDNGVPGGSMRQIRLIGQAPVFRKNIFDMVADEERFHIFIPTKNKFIVGATRTARRSDNPIENLRPQHLFEALFLEAASPDSLHLLEENEFGGRRYYGVSEIIPGDDGKMVLHRRWWFERSQLELVRVQRFDARGRLVADIHYDQWRTEEGVPYPHQIELARPQDDYRLRLIVKRLTLNQPIAPEKFQLERPPGVELVELQAEAGTAPAPEEPQ
ncbi:MAG: hypothetical protein ACE5HL_01085 [Terriglobia bacterium]